MLTPQNAGLLALRDGRWHDRDWEKCSHLTPDLLSGPAFPMSGGAMSTTTDETVADRLEAQIREAMARLPKARGWDTGRVRDDGLAWLDVLLDQYLDLRR